MPIAVRNFASDWTIAVRFSSMSDEIAVVPKESDLHDDQKRSRCGDGRPRFRALADGDFGRIQGTNIALNLTLDFFNIHE
jgi:hypothetical protein